MPHFLCVALLVGVLAGQVSQKAPAATPVSGARQEAASQATPGTETAPDESLVSVGADLLATNAFVWRGFVDVDAMVVQPAVWVRVGGLTVSSWFNAAPSAPNGKVLTEHDLTVDYAVTRGRYTLSAGWINYAFIDDEVNRHSDEIYLGVAREGLLSPTLKVYQDVHAGSGTYVNLGVEHTLACGRGVDLTGALSVGYNHKLYTEHSALSDAVAGLTLSIPTPVKGLTLSPFAAYSFSLDDRIATDRFYWGASASIATR